MVQLVKNGCTCNECYTPPIIMFFTHTLFSFSIFLILQLEPTRFVLHQCHLESFNRHDDQTCGSGFCDDALVSVMTLSLQCQRPFYHFQSHQEPCVHRRFRVLLPRLIPSGPTPDDLGWVSLWDRYRTSSFLATDMKNIYATGFIGASDMEFTRCNNVFIDFLCNPRILDTLNTEVDPSAPASLIIRWLKLAYLGQLYPILLRV